MMWKGGEGKKKGETHYCQSLKKAKEPKMFMGKETVFRHS